MKQILYPIFITSLLYNCIACSIESPINSNGAQKTADSEEVTLSAPVSVPTSTPSHFITGTLSPTGHPTSTSSQAVTTPILLEPDPPPTLLASAILTPTILTPTPTPVLSTCLPPTSPSKVERTVELMVAKDQAMASGKLPDEGTGIEYDLSYNQKELFIGWVYSMDRKELLSYNLAENSVKSIARLGGWWIPSPASDCIILSGAVEGEDQDSIYDFDRDVNIIDSEGQVYHFEIDTDRLKIDDKGDARFAWSPDGMQLVINERFKPDQERLYLVSVDGSKVQPLFLNEEQESFGVSDIDWSPTKEQVAVAAYAFANQTDEFRVGLFIFDLKTKERQLLVEEILGGQMAWSPDGKYLYFRNPNGECKKMDVDIQEISSAETKTCRGF